MMCDEWHMYSRMLLGDWLDYLLYMIQLKVNVRALDSHDSKSGNRNELHLCKHLLCDLMLSAPVNNMHKDEARSSHSQM